jgi:2-succinyl-6-hydroxy-2,4-cyclohexadiene-1-carboxylate synthase
MRVGFIHGFAGGPEVWADVISGVGGVEATCATLPGHGRSTVQPTWDANLGEIAEELGRLDVVVGYSLGARVALGLVATGRAPRAIAISVNPGLDDTARAARRVIDAAWADMLRARGLAKFIVAWEAQPLFATQARADAARRAARRARRLALDPEQLARSLEVMGVADMPDYHAAVAARVALIAGADDPKYLAIARALPAPLEVIAGSGHDPTLEQPALLAAAIGRLLA